MKRHFFTLAEATDALLRYSPWHMEGSYNLSRITRLLASLGNPQEKFATIHIAGTSGKTSTAYLLRGILEDSGQKTGLTISPHIVAVNERVQIDGRPLEEETFLRYLEEFLELVDASHDTPTYFEQLIAFAYWVFAREKVDYAVVETGVGGRLDATNTITRPDKVCVLTHIGRDHTHLLGDTLEKIASEKAGIIHSGNHVFAVSQPVSVLDVFRTHARDVGATLEVVVPTKQTLPQSLPLFQLPNLALAQRAANYAANRDGFVVAPRPRIETPPGRFERVLSGDRTVVLDGAHNPQKMSALLESLAAEKLLPAHFLFAFKNSPGKDLETTLRSLLPHAASLTVTCFSVGMDEKIVQSIDPHRVARMATELAPKLQVRKSPRAHDALTSVLNQPDTLPIVVTGSLYLVSEVRSHKELALL